METENIANFNIVIQKYFENNSFVNTIRAKNMMPFFIDEGIFTKDEKEGLPIRKLLRKLDKVSTLHLIPSVRPERKKVNTNWFFDRRISG